MKKIVAYCGIHTNHGSGYVRWAKKYLEMTDDQRVKFLKDIIDELEFEAQFILRLIESKKTSSERPNP
jgi:hypothetical protein